MIMENKDNRFCECEEDVLDNDMVSWRNDPCGTAADTYIEWCFEKKCQCLKNGFDILTEWRNKKRQHVSRLEMIAFDFQHFSRHDDSHAVNILEIIEMILGKKRVNLLSVGDLWILLECAYTHDLGMSLNYQELKKLWEEDENFRKYIENALIGVDSDEFQAAGFYKRLDNLIRGKEFNAEIEKYQYLENIFPESWPVELTRSISLLISGYVRPKHARRVWEASRKEDGEADSAIMDRLYDAMLTACELHGKAFTEIINELSYCAKGFGNTQIHPRFAAAMLQIGDMLDLDNNRFNPRVIERWGNLPHVSMLHYQKHKAITHIAIKETGIEIEAKSNDIEVCSVISEWFEMIDKTTKELMYHWNEIMPPSLQGCLLCPSKCVVYYVEGSSDAKLLAKKDRGFEVNKKKMIDLLIGSSIYTNKMDFAREYLQNALDATKMQLWIDLKNGIYNFSELINPETIDEDIHTILPFDINEEIYKHYEIRIYIDLDLKRQKVKMSFVDNGIGMEDDCIKTIARIGTGWRGRKKYNSEINSMPKWLRPTGGFGIGLQSAFMVTDKVVIYTKSADDFYGKKLTLQSPQQKGILEEEALSGIQRGTRIEVEIDLKTFYEINRMYQFKENEKKNWYDSLYADFDNRNDFFDGEEIKKYIAEFEKRYLDIIIAGTFFPVRIIYSYGNIKSSLVVKNKAFIGYMTPGFSNESRQYRKQFVLDKKKYTGIVNTVNGGESLKCFVWDYEDNTAFYFYVNPSIITAFSNERWWKSVNQKIYFKNVLVKDEMISQNYSKKGIYLMVDFMGLTSEEALKVYRDVFNNSFQKKVIPQYVYMAYRVFFLMMDYLNDKVGIVHTSGLGQFFSCQDILLFRMFRLGEDGIKLLSDKLDDQISLEGNIQGYMLILDEKKEKYILKSKMISPRIALGKIANFLKDENGQLILVMKDESINADVSSIGSKVIDMYCQRITISVKGKKIVHSNNEEGGSDRIDDQTKILDHILIFQQDSEKEKEEKIIITQDSAKDLLESNQFDMKFFRLYGEGPVYVCLTHKKKMRTIARQKLLERSFGNIGIKDEKTEAKRYVGKFVPADFYPELQILYAPFEKGIEEKSTEKEYRVISPINGKIYRNIIDYKERGQNIDFKEFRACIVKDETYKNLIRYVYDQKIEMGQQISKDQIERSYNEYIREIYEQVKNNLNFPKPI